MESIKTRRRKKQNREGVVINKDGDIIIQTKNQSIPTLVLPKNSDSDSLNSPKAYCSSASPRRVLHSPLFFHSRDDTSRNAFVNRRGSVSLDRRDTIEVMSDSEVQRTSKKLRNFAKFKAGHNAVSDCDSDLDELEIGQYNR